MPTAIATPLNAGLNRVATPPVMKPVVAAMDNAIAIVADAVDVVAVTDKVIVANAPSAMSAANGTQKVQHARRKTPLLRVKPVSHANRVNRVNRDRIVAPVAKVSAKLSAKVVLVRVSAMADVMVDAMVVAKAGMTLHAIRKTHVPIKPMPRQHRLRAATKRRRRTVLAGNAAKAAVNDVSVVSAGTVVNVAANAANVARTRLPSLRQPVARCRCAATTTQLSTVSRKLKAAISKLITSRNHKPALLATRA
jgi:hypothetical protein